MQDLSRLQGPAGGITLFYVFNTTTAAPPANGEVRFDNANYSLVTTVWISDTDANGTNMDPVLDAFNVGDIIRIFDPTDPTKFAFYQVTSNTDSGAYHTFGVNFIASNGAFINGQSVDVGWGPIGPQGWQGPQGSSGSGFQGPQGEQGAQGNQGDLGFQGTQGPQGFQGDQGGQGPQGLQGFQGPQGDRGYQGYNRVYIPFGYSARVPGAGTLQLANAGYSLAGTRLNRAGTIVGATIQVGPAADGVRSYNLDLRVNAVSVATLALAAGSIGASTTALAVGFVANDVLSAFMVKTAGAGVSTFDEIEALVELAIA